MTYHTIECFRGSGYRKEDVSKIERRDELVREVTEAEVDHSNKRLTKYSEDLRD